jgi:hypothetical protein
MAPWLISLTGLYFLATGDIHDFNINKTINKSGIAMAKAAFNKKKALFTSTSDLK